MIGAIELHNPIIFDLLERPDRDPEKVLRHNGVTHVNLEMLFGDHIITDPLRTQIESYGADVLIGELHIDDTIRVGMERSAVIKEDQDTLEIFLGKLLGSSGLDCTEAGSILDRGYEHIVNLSRLLNDGVAIGTLEGSKFVNSDEFAARSRASIESGLLYERFLQLAFAATIAADLEARKGFKTLISERRFNRRTLLKLGFAGTAWLGEKVINAFTNTMYDTGEWEPPGSMPITGFYSKFRRAVTSAKEKTIGIISDKEVQLGFTRLVRLRDFAMALNSWYVIDAIDRNADLRQAVAGDGEQNAQVVGIYGMGHAGIKDIFSEGPKTVETGLAKLIEYFTSQFPEDVRQDQGKLDEIVLFYQDIFGALASPVLHNEGGTEHTAYSTDEAPRMSSAQGLLYKALLRGAELPGTDGQAIKALLGVLLKDHMDTLIPIPSEYFADVSYPNKPNERSYAPLNDRTLVKRIAESGLSPQNPLSQNANIELVEKAADVNYLFFGKDPGDVRTIGILFINGIPHPYFSKETLPESIKQEL